MGIWPILRELLPPFFVPRRDHFYVGLDRNQLISQGAKRLTDLSISARPPDACQSGHSPEPSWDFSRSMCADASALLRLAGSCSPACLARVSR
jgi:hypothetical protein